MQTYVVENTGDSVTIGFKDANLTFITPLMQELYNNKNVDLVRYIDTHPELDDRRLYVKMKKGKALDALAKASESLADYFTFKE